MKRILCFLLTASSVFAAMTRSPSSDGGVTCSRTGSGVCTFTFTCTVGVCTSAEVLGTGTGLNASIEVILNTEIRRGDLILLNDKAMDGTQQILKPSRPFIFHGYPVSGGSGYLLFGGLQQSKLPADGHRITPGYNPVLPWIELANVGYSLIELRGEQNNVAEHIKFKGIRFFLSSAFPRAPSSTGRSYIAAGNPGSDGPYGEGALAPQLSGTVDVSSSGVVSNFIGVSGNCGGCTDFTKVNLATGKWIRISGYNYEITSKISNTQLQLDTGKPFAAPPNGTALATKYYIRDQWNAFGPHPEYQPDDIIFQHIVMDQENYDRVVNTGINFAGRAITVRDSWIDGIYGGSGEEKGIAGVNGVGPYVVENNFIQSTGENMFSGGGRRAIGNEFRPGSIGGFLVRYNYFPKVEERFRKMDWRPNMRVFKGRVVMAANTNSATGTTFTYIARNTGTTGATAPTFCKNATGCVCTNTNGSCTVTDNGIIWELYTNYAGNGQPRKIKNLFEFKDGENLDLSYNTFDKYWDDGDQKFFINMKTTNQCFDSFQDAAYRSAGVANVVNGVVTPVSGDPFPANMTPTANDRSTFWIKLGATWYPIMRLNANNSGGFLINTTTLVPYIQLAQDSSGSGATTADTTTTLGNVTYLYGTPGFGRNGSAGWEPDDNHWQCSESIVRNNKISNNVLRHGISGTLTYISINAAFHSVENIQWINNLFYDIDRYKWGANGGNIGSPNGTILEFSINGPIPGYVFSHNTIQGVGPVKNFDHIIRVPGAIQDAIIRDNFFTQKGSAGFIDAETQNYGPGETATNQYLCGTQRCPPSQFGYNVAGGEDADLYYTPSHRRTGSAVGMPNLNSIVVSSGVATVNLAGPYAVEPYAVGQRIVVYGATAALSLNDSNYRVSSVPSATSFTFPAIGTPDGTYAESTLTVVRPRIYNLCPNSWSTCSVNLDAVSDWTGQTGPVFRDRASGNFRLSSTSPYENKASDGTSIGVDYTQLPLLEDLKAEATDRAALITYTLSAPIAHIAAVAQCSTTFDYDYTTTIPDLRPELYAGWSSGATRPDADDHDTSTRSGNRRMILLGKNTPLTPNTTIYCMIHAGGATERIEFTTKGALSGTSAQTIKFVSQTAGTKTISYGYTYSRATDAIGSPASASASCSAGAPCTISFSANKGSIVYYRFGTGKVLTMAIDK